MPVRLLPSAALVLLVACLAGPAFAQFGPAGPPAVGVVKAVREPITESSEFVGRIQAVNRVAIVARVTAFLDKRFFTEGTEVKQGELLYRLEQAPFQADVAAKQAAVAQANAQLQNATITLTRAQSLLNTPAGQRSTYDDALALQRTDAALLAAAQANLQTSQINLGYTEIHAPIDGLIGRTAITEGNVVSPSSGTLTTIVGQDPMYVVFPVSVREALDLRDRYVAKGGFAAVVIKVRLPNGKIYDQEGRLDFVDNTIAPTTDTIILRGVIPNPIRPGAHARRARLARARRRRVRHRAAPGRGADRGARHPARGRAGRPAGQLRLCGGRAEQGRARQHPARPVHARPPRSSPTGCRKARPSSWTGCSACGPASRSIRARPA